MTCRRPDSAPATRGKVDYQGHHLHGRTLPVVATGDFHGLPLIVLDDDGIRIGLPADKVQVFPAESAAGRPEQIEPEDILAATRIARTSAKPTETAAAHHATQPVLEE